MPIRQLVACFVVCGLASCAEAPSPGDAGEHSHHHQDAGAVDGGHMHVEDAGVVDDGGHMHVEDAGIDDGGHMHVEDAGIDDGGHVHIEDAGIVDGGHMHIEDAGIVDGGHMHVEDAGIDDGGHLHVDAGSLDPDVPYEAPWAPVTQTTTQVATIPRPAHIVTPPPSDCPHLQSGLQPWNAQWSVQDGEVTLPAGARVLLSGNSLLPESTRIRRLNVPAGTELVIDDAPATWRFTDIRVQGVLRMGSATCRLQSDISFIFDTAEDVADAGVRQTIYAREGLGLVVENGGELQIHGRLFQPTWTRLRGNAYGTTASTAENVDWQPGQDVLLVTNRPSDYPLSSGNQVRQLASVAQLDGGSTLNFTDALTSSIVTLPEFATEVALLSRSIRFSTAASVLTAAPTFGGHILIHGSKAQVSGVELRGLGQQNLIGRYPFHFHHVDGRNGSFFTDSTVRESNWRAVVIHRTDNVLVSRNVSYDVFGHAFYVEDGVERHNELSFNLAARTKPMGSLALISSLDVAPQEGVDINASPELVQPSDVAAAGFYISNGNNRIVGNAASGGFAGFTFPALPEALGPPSNIVPLAYGVSHFDGNTAHSANYLWGQAGCIYAGGVLRYVDVNGVRTLQYRTGRTTDWGLLRHAYDTFNNTRTLHCAVGLTHWGSTARVVNFESTNNGLLAQVFGSASIQSAVVKGRTGFMGTAPGRYWVQGFQFYDTDTQTILSDVVFRGFRDRLVAGDFADWNDCALFSMTHSDEWTPQNMNATQRLYFDDVAPQTRFCHAAKGTLASRNFNLFDSDGSATRVAGDGLPPGPRLVASAFVDIWNVNAGCVRNTTMNLWTCPLTGPFEVAAVNTVPNLGVRATMYSMTNAAPRGENWFSTTSSFIDAQLTGPARLGWHHQFPNGVPATFDIYSLQVPANAWVVYSFSLPPGVSCSVSGAGWQQVANVSALLASPGSVFTTDRGTCFIRLEPTNGGVFTASGLSIPGQTSRWFPTSTTYFTVNTGCSSANAACQSLTSTLPVLP